jgi:hypothetical protein
MSTIEGASKTKPSIQGTKIHSLSPMWDTSATPTTPKEGGSSIGSDWTGRRRGSCGRIHLGTCSPARRSPGIMLYLAAVRQADGTAKGGGTAPK